jgi:hypothetical protein
MTRIHKENGQRLVQSRPMEGPKGVSPRPPAALTVALWHDPASAVPPNLMAELTRRGISVTVVTNPFMALATVCREERRNGAPAKTALVMVEPAKLPDAAAMYDALSRYAPASRCWMFAPGSNPPLRAVVEADVERWRPATTVEPPAVVVRPQPHPLPSKPGPPPPAAYRTKPLPQPALRITGSGPVEQAGKPVDQKGAEFTDPEEGARTSQLLTPEELRMLLGEDDGGPGAAKT